MARITVVGIGIAAFVVILLLRFPMRSEPPFQRSVPATRLPCSSCRSRFWVTGIILNTFAIGVLLLIIRFYWPLLGLAWW